MAAAATIRSLLQALPSIQATNNIIIFNENPSFLSFASTNLLESKTLALRATLNPFSLYSKSRLLVSSSSGEVSNEEEEEEEGEEESGDEEEESEEVEEEGSRARASGREKEKPRRLYVGNLPYTITAAELKELFEDHGTVEAVEIVYDRLTDRSRGFAFITMDDHESAEDAMYSFDGTQINGRTVKVNFPEVPRGGERELMGPHTRARSRGYVDSPYKVYCGNLGWTVTSETLKDAFADQPGLLGAKVIYERDSGRSRGFGFVSFGSQEEAQAAIESLNGKEVGGRPLRLNLASERSKAPAATS